MSGSPDRGDSLTQAHLYSPHSHPSPLNARTGCLATSNQGTMQRTDWKTMVVVGRPLQPSGRKKKVNSKNDVFRPCVSVSGLTFLFLLFCIVVIL